MEGPGLFRRCPPTPDRKGLCVDARGVSGVGLVRGDVVVVVVMACVVDVFVLGVRRGQMGGGGLGGGEVLVGWMARGPGETTALTSCRRAGSGDKRRYFWVLRQSNHSLFVQKGLYLMNAPFAQFNVTRLTCVCAGRA